MSSIATRLQRYVPGLLIVCGIWCVPSAQADPILWYNGNLDNRDAFSNQTSSVSPGGVDGRIYDDFIVPTGQSWTITSVFSNDVANPIQGGYSSATASWQILSGVSAGSGGTVVASGDGADSITATGRTSSVFAPFAASEYKNQVGGLSVTLGPGTYWLSVAPDTDGAVDSYWNISTTSGAGAIGNPPGNDGNSFFTSSFTGDYFTPTASLEGPGNWDYSMGVLGTAQPLTSTPEPTSMTLLVAASFSLAGFNYCRRKFGRLADRQSSAGSA
jgi:hypothetical protein